MTGEEEFLRFRLTVRVHEDDEESLPLILRNLADRYEARGAPLLRALPVIDGNGNTIGTALLSPWEEPIQ